MRRASLCIAVLVSACGSRGVRKDVGPTLADDAPQAAAAEAAAREGTLPLSREEMIEHVLSRATFGARAQDRERLARIGVAAFLEEQLHPEKLDDGALEKRLERYSVLRRDAASLASEMTETRGRKKDFVTQLSEAKLLRAVASERQLREVMADFWFNHFNVFAGKQQEAALLPAYDQMLREGALGNFPELLEATARSPAMLIYLDNWRSTSNAGPPARRFPVKARPRGLNENYARELLELHTLGVDGGYSQQDVVDVARCFTGWTVEAPKSAPRFVFRPRLHDGGPKSVLGHLIPSGRGEEDAQEVLRVLSAHPSTARFISRKLARRFVSDDPPEALVERMAATYLRTSGDIRSMLRVLFESPELWSRRALRAKVRSPLELVAASARALGATVEDPGALARAVARIGEPLYAAQPPTGYGDTAQAWLSSGALLARIDFGLQLAANGLNGVRIDLASLSGGAAEEVLDRAAERLGAAELSDRTREHVLGELRAASGSPESRTARAVGLLLGSPELQRR